MDSRPFEHVKVSIVPHDKHECEMGQASSYSD